MRNRLIFCRALLRMATVKTKDPVSLEKLRSITPLAGLDLLHKVAWTSVNE